MKKSYFVKNLIDSFDKDRSNSWFNLLIIFILFILVVFMSSLYFNKNKL